MAKRTDSDIHVAIRLNKFSFNMMDTICADEKNIICSPFSIYTALAMLGLGAQEKTKKEIISVLKWEDDDLLPLLEMLKPLYISLSKEQNGATFNIANKAWVADNVNLLKTYQERLNNYFQVEVGKEDFANDPELARSNINKWVADRTGQHIKELFPKGSIQCVTHLVLANAVYFKGEWANKFDQSHTHKDVFHVVKGKKVIVDFMVKKNQFSTAVDNDHKVQLLELPYAKGMFSMMFAIPLRQNQLKNVESKIKNKEQVFNKWIKILGGTSVEVKIYIPKFEIKLNLDIADNLKKLGICEVFMPGANLSGINGKMDLSFSAALHEAYLKVDEEGTVAAAATGFGMLGCAMALPNEIHLNHPFLFYIIHKSSNTIIFSGKVKNPVE